MTVVSGESDRGRGLNTTAFKSSAMNDPEFLGNVTLAPVDFSLVM